MDWLTQAFPNCSQDTIKQTVRYCNGNYVEAHKLLSTGVGIYFGIHAASETLAVSKTSRQYETTQDLIRDAAGVHRSLVAALPRLTTNFVTELFRHLAFPRPDNMAEITAECWMFVVDQVVYEGSSLGSNTVGHILTSLTEFISQEHPSNPEYLNIRHLISAYKLLNWIPGIIELPESGYEIEWYHSSFDSVPVGGIHFNCSEMCCEDVHPREMTVCTGPDHHNCCYKCASRWAGEQIDTGKTTMKCVYNNKCQGDYSDTEAGLFLNPEKYAKLHRQRFGLEKFEDEPGWFQCPLDCGFSCKIDNVEQMKYVECPKCRKIICGVCKRLKHDPLSCRDYQNDPKVAANNLLAEAMHKASVRVCNKCKREFEKRGNNECNQVTCLACGNIQCYICSATVPSDHSHFRTYGGKGTCDLYGDPGLRAQVARAKVQTVGNLVQAVPGLRESDFRV